MRDEDLERLIRSSMERHVDDVHPAEDLGPALVQRGRRVRRRRRVAAVTGAGSTLALALAVTVAIPHLGQGPGPASPAQSAPAGPATPGPTDQRLQATEAPAPTTTTAPAPAPSRTHAAPTPTPTVTRTETATASATPSTASPAPDRSATPSTAAPTSAPSTQPAPGAGETSTFPTPYGRVAYPAGMHDLLKGQQVGDRYVALVAANNDLTDSAPPNQGQLLSIGPDRKPYVIDQASTDGQIGSFAVSPDQRSVADDRTEFGSAEEQVNVWPIADPAHWTARYYVPQEWWGTVTDWTSDGVVVTGQQSPSTLVWQPSSGRVVTRATPSAAPTVLRPGS